MFNGGYIMLDLRESSEKVLKQASICANQDKPVLVYDANGKGTFMNITSDGASGYILTGASSSFAIASDGTVTSYSGVLMENIKDKNGNLRFVEFPLAPRTITGLNFSYSKVSLSGTHLMIVLSGTIDAATAAPSNAVLASVQLPSYILDKIVPISGDYERNVSIINITTFDTETWYSETHTWQSLRLQKVDNGIQIQTAGSTFTTTNENGFRIQFDLLIDAE